MIHDLAQTYSMLPFAPVKPGRTDVGAQPAALIRMHRILNLGRREKRMTERAEASGRRSLLEERKAEQREREAADADLDDAPLGPFAAAILAARGGGELPGGVDD